MLKESRGRPGRQAGHCGVPTFEAVCWVDEVQWETRRAGYAQGLGVGA